MKIKDGLLKLQCSLFIDSLIILKFKFKTEFLNNVFFINWVILLDYYNNN